MKNIHSHILCSQTTCPELHLQKVGIIAIYKGNAMKRINKSIILNLRASFIMYIERFAKASHMSSKILKESCLKLKNYMQTTFHDYLYKWYNFEIHNYSFG